jgi:hypothetical protein
MGNSLQDGAVVIRLRHDATFLEYPVFFSCSMNVFYSPPASAAAEKQ